MAPVTLDHGVVCLPNMFGGGTEGKPGLCEAWFIEGGVDPVLVAVLLGVGGLKVGGNGGA